jgi:hypothetical protein
LNVVIIILVVVSMVVVFPFSLQRCANIAEGGGVSEKATYRLG